MTTQRPSDQETIRNAVREGYSKIAETPPTHISAAGQSQQGDECCGGGGCCGPTTIAPADLAERIGYSTDELAAIPEGANMGLSCGNPTAIASLRPGDVVLDLGSGGGFDIFLAGPKVGPTGRAIGIDMTPAMITKARSNIAPYRAQTGLDNVEFRLGEIEYLPVPDHSVDVVISNCVLNLSPDKPQVWREMFRVLKPGGRVAVSDLALLRPLPEEIRGMIEALIACVAGAVLIEETREMAVAAGFADVRIEPKPEYIDTMDSWQDPLYQQIVATLPAGAKASDYITSANITALRPA